MRRGRHAAPARVARPLRWLARRPVAAALLCGGLLAVSAGGGGLILRAGHPGISPRPAAKGGRAPSGEVVAAPSPLATVSVAQPVYLYIPAAGIRTRVIRLGLTAQGALQVPVSTAVAGWYTGSPRPGQIGSAIIVGHIDSRSGPGVFFRLRLLRAGDRVFVRHADGTLAVFRVYAERAYPKDRFPTARVYGPVPDAELRLITCGGVFDASTGSYLSNVVVFAAQSR